MDREIEDSLLDIFQKTINGRYPELSAGDMIIPLKELMARKKFDSQDQALIELIIKDKDKLFEESFLESLEHYVERTASGKDKMSFLQSEEGQIQIVKIYVSSLERTIDYFYNVLFNSQFFTA